MSILPFPRGQSCTDRGVNYIEGDYMYYEDKLIESLGKEIIKAREELDHIREYEYKIGYLVSDMEKKQGDMPVLADIRKVTGIWKMYCPYDFIIIVYDPNTCELSEAQLQVLLFHELLHIGEGGSLRQHNVQDFRIILEEYGLNWSIDPEIKPVLRGEEHE